MYQPITKEFFPKQQANISALLNNSCRKIERELTSEEEKAAFLYTSKINSARIFAKHFD